MKMSLEEAVKENTEAMKELTAVIQAAGGITGTDTPAPASSKKKTTKKTPAKKPKEEPEVEEEEQEEEGEVTLEEVTAAVLAAAERDRPAVVKVLGDFGVKKASELDPGDYLAFLSLVKKIK